jgi:hypothetical protein
LGKLSSSENARGNQQDSFAPLIHGEQCSIFRFYFACWIWSF